MATAVGSSPLEDLDLSREEVQRLTSAFQDPEFRRMFSEYTKEITDPENRRRYEAEITALERERGVEVRFLHPQPGYVLRTSLDGVQRCYVNVCSNALVGAPSCRPCPGQGSHWFIPYSLAPARQYAGRYGSRYTVYDVVFHPDTLALARRQAGFHQTLQSTAVEAVENHFSVQLDRRNIKTLKIRYKGTPEAAVLRKPLPGGGKNGPERAAEDPLPEFPYPYGHPAPGIAQSSASPRQAPPSPPEAAAQPAHTVPRCSVVQRHHVDLDDYRCSRDSAPSPVPHELVVTIDLPLLRAAEQAELEVSGRLLSLDSRTPDYRLRLSLPYPVDDSRGKAQFNKARRQLVVTLPVVRPVTRLEPISGPEEPVPAPGEQLSASEESLPAPEEPVRAPEEQLSAPEESLPAPEEPVPAPEEQLSAPEESLPAPEEPVPAPEEFLLALEAPSNVPGSDEVSAAFGAQEELVSESVERVLGAFTASPSGLQNQQPCGAWSPTGDVGEGSPFAATRSVAWESPAASEREGECGDPSDDSEGAGGQPWDPAMRALAAENREPLCPPLRCSQDEDSLTVLVQVPGIQPQSFQGELNPPRYTLNFSTPDSAYSLRLQFAPENKLSTEEPEISVSSDNAVVVLAKSPGSRGHWREWFYDLDRGSLEESLFVTEENVNQFLEEVLDPAFEQTVPRTPPLIEVPQVTDEKIEIHAKLQECSSSDQLQGKEERISGGCPLTNNEDTGHLTTSTIDVDSSVAVEAPEADICGTVAGFQQESLDVSHTKLGASQPPVTKMDPRSVEGESAAYSHEEDHFKEPIITDERKLDGSHQSSTLNQSIVHGIPGFDSLKEISMQDGSVQVIKDHVTRCAFSFQNPLLYDLD